ncbi:hypothetical protein MAQ5080_00397 [Marinomonas aquimarina]|uniref:TadE-like protein n=1 Tax=Marinomonas aquimarina TaxID=295068 RepID=A0A1A8T3C9_9GAMM|nr:hypothetical protein [Marinomonas aquimarina]SBS25887.1 hypothetical protein MAQ5080_00397 [Marinomonas aquimarina]
MKAKRTLANSSKKQSGLVSLELALGFVSFWLVCMIWIEMSYVSYVSAMGDMMISHASSQAKRGEDVDFQVAFNDSLNQSDSLWESFIGDGSGFESCVYYVTSYTALKSLGEDTDICEQGDGADDTAPIAIYQVHYGYTPMFTTFTDSTPDLFSREMIVIQESQLE